MRPFCILAIVLLAPAPSLAQAVTFQDGNLFYRASADGAARQLTSDGLDRDPRLSADGTQRTSIRSAAPSLFPARNLRSNRDLFATHGTRGIVPGYAPDFSRAIQRSTLARSMGSVTAPSSSTTSWNRRRSNALPSSRRACSRRRTISR